MIMVNINNPVKVKMTKEGKAILRDRFYSKGLYKFIDFKYPEEDKNGFVTMPLWDVMNTFGEYLYLGSTIQPIETSIIILEKE